MLLSPSMLRRLSEDRRLPDDARRALRRAAETPLDQRYFTASPGALALIHDCGGSEELPGTAIDPATSTDPTVRRAHQFTSDAIRFLEACFNRSSYDDQGASIVSSVHYSRIYSNAYWNGSQMVYGDGDGLMILDFTLSPEFVGHEVFHGVTQHACGLVYEGEAGALNESMSDVFGSMFSQWRLSQTVGQANWRIGDELMGPLAHDFGWNCVRDLADPMAAASMTKQPKHYSGYDPNGGPHDNSGIPNHAFYLAAMAIGGRSWEKVGKIWYAGLTDPMTHPRTTFREFARTTLRHARGLFAGDRTVAHAVRIAWRQVGISI